MPATEIRPAKAVYYDLATKAFDTQLQQIDQLDAKASQTLAAASAAVAVIAGLLALATPAKGGVKPATGAIFIAGLVIYLFTGSVLMWSLKVRKWDFGPEFEPVALETGQRDLDVVQDWLADAFVDSVKGNKTQVDCKSRLINYGLYGLFAESVVLVAAVGSILFVR